MAGYQRQLTPTQFLAHLRNLRSKFDAEIAQAKREISIKSVEHFKAGFDRGGFGTGGSKWAARAKPYPHKTLKKTGALQGSIVAFAHGQGDLIQIHTSNPYSQFHNDSTRTSHSQPQGNYGYNIQRQFMGNSPVLERWIERRLITALKNTFR